MPIEFAEVTVTRRALPLRRERVPDQRPEGAPDGRAGPVPARAGRPELVRDMSQGLVDEVLALRPLERRDLIEEAADVRRHRHQLTLSERRLVGDARQPRPRAHADPRGRAAHPRAAAPDDARRALPGARRPSCREALQVYFEHELRAAHEALACGARAARPAQRRRSRRRAALATRWTRASRQLNALPGRAPRSPRGARRRASARCRGRAAAGSRRSRWRAQRLELLTSRQADLQVEIGASRPSRRSDEPRRRRRHRARGARSRSGARPASASAKGCAPRTRRCARVLRDLNEAEARRARLEAEHAEAERRLHEARGRASVRSRRSARAPQTARTGSTRGAARASGSARWCCAAEARRDRDHGEPRPRAARRTTSARSRTQLRLVVEARDALRVARVATAAARGTRRAPDDAARAARASAAKARAPSSRPAQARAEDDEGALTRHRRLVTGLLRVPDGLDLAIEAALAEQLSAVVVERRGRRAGRRRVPARAASAGTATVLRARQRSAQYPRQPVQRARRDRRRGAPREVRGRVPPARRHAARAHDRRRGPRDGAARWCAAASARWSRATACCCAPVARFRRPQRRRRREQFSLRRELEELPAQAEALARGVEGARERLAVLEDSTVGGARGRRRRARELRRHRAAARDASRRRRGRAPPHRHAERRDALLRRALLETQRRRRRPASRLDAARAGHRRTRDAGRPARGACATARTP